MNASLIKALVFAMVMSSATFVAWAITPTHFLADDKPSISLASMFPERFGEWEVDPSVIPVQPPPELQRTIEATYDQTLSRTYRNASGQQVMMSIAYGRNQHRGMNTHRPEVCYPSQGFPILQSGSPETLAFGDTQIPVTRMVASRSERHEPITYWLIVGDEVTNFGRNYKLQTFRYGIKGDIPDGMLLRFSSINRDDQEGFLLQKRLIVDLLMHMTPAGKTAVLGKLFTAA